MKKRLLATLLAAVMVCALLPVTAMAADITIGEVIPYMYDEVGDFSEGLAAVKWNGKWGYIDRTGRMVISYQYSSAHNFSDGIAEVELNGKGWSYIDKTGKEIAKKPAESVNLYDRYVFIGAFSEGVAMAQSEKTALYGIIDKVGKEVIPFKYYKMSNFYEGMAAAMDKNGKWGFVNKTGKEVIPCKYQNADDFHEGFAAVQLNGKWGFIDKTGKEVIPCNYRRLDDWKLSAAAFASVERASFSEGLARVKLNDEIIFIDKTGKEAVSARKYSYVEDFHEGLAAVELDGKWGYIDKTGKEVASPHKYDFADSFSEGMAAVKLSGKWGFIAIDGYVPLYLDGGSGTDYIIADSSNTMAVPTNPTKPGYTFGGWYTDAALTIPWNFNNKVVNTLTLYAKWIPVSSTASKTGKSQSVISLNGKNVTLDAYTLKAANGGDVTYVKLRDIAALLENTNAKFNVDWRRGAIYVTTKSAYTTKNGGELKAISGTDGSYKWNTAPVLFDGTTKALEGIVITDGKGGGHTFFKLRDLGETIGFTVDWTRERGIFIETK